MRRHQVNLIWVMTLLFVLGCGSSSKKNLKSSASGFEKYVISIGWNAVDTQPIESECDKGSAYACLLLESEFYEFDRSKPAAGKFKIQHFRKLLDECERGRGSSCEGAGIAFAYGFQVERNEQLELEYYVKACDLGWAPGCASAGNYQDARRDYASSVAYNRKACDGSFLTACAYLGLSYLHGEGVPLDGEKAYQLSKRACDGGDGNGCNVLAHLYRRGVYVPENKEKAFYMYLDACSNVSDACVNMAISALNGEGVRRNIDMAVGALNAACERRENGYACYTLWNVVNTEPNATGTYLTSEQLLNLTCSLGYPAPECAGN